MSNARELTSRAWCFTINNPTVEDGEALQEIEPKIKYMICGREKGAEGTKHMQGYVNLKVPISMSALKKKYLPRAHMEMAKGDAESNRVYCSKEGDFQEWGVLPMSNREKGKKGKEYWLEQLQYIKDKEEDKIDPRLVISHFNALQNIAAKYAPMPEDLPKLENLWFYGPSGTGKSSSARKEFPDSYMKAKNKWWDGYAGQETVIIDDVDIYDVKMAYDLKIWSDHYAFRAEVKGSTMPVRPKRIVVTSQYRITDIWSDVETREALLRRFTEREFKAPKGETCIMD